MSENELLIRESNGKTVLENMLDGGKTPSCLDYNERQSIKIILNKRKYNLLEYCSINNLLRLNTLGERFIDTILKLFLKGEKGINIALFDPFDKTRNIDQIANYYLVYAKYDLVDYLPGLTKELLLKRLGGKDLLSTLLRKNKNLTVDKLLTSELKKDFDIAMILRNYNIMQSNVSIDVLKDNFAQKKIKEYNEELGKVFLKPEEEDALNRLYNELVFDSSIDAIETLIRSFKLQIKSGYPHVLEEIELLIKIKQNDRNFRIVMGNETSYKVSTSTITLDSPLISSLDHELGHMLFHKLTSCKIDEEFFNIINRIEENPKNIEKVSDFSRRYHSLSKKIKKYVSDEYDKAYYLINSRDSLTRIQKFLNEEKQKKIDIFLKKGYSIETLNIIFDNFFTVKEYLSQHKKIKKRELKNAIFDLEIAPIMAISDIIDAVYKGKLMAGKLVDNTGNEIKACPGHGLYYYNTDSRVIFDEIIANYNMIIKSDNKERYLNLLKDYTSEELVNYLNTFYEKNILGFNILQTKEGEKVWKKQK